MYTSQAVRMCQQAKCNSAWNEVQAKQSSLCATVKMSNVSHHEVGISADSMCAVWVMWGAAHFVSAALNNLSGFCCEAIQCFCMDPSYRPACSGLCCLWNPLKNEWLQSGNQESINIYCSGDQMGANRQEFSPVNSYRQKVFSTCKRFIWVTQSSCQLHHVY